MRVPRTRACPYIAYPTRRVTSTAGFTNPYRSVGRSVDPHAGYSGATTGGGRFLREKQRRHLPGVCVVSVYCLLGKKAVLAGGRAHTHTNIRARAFTNTHKFIRTHTHTCIHTRTQGPSTTKHFRIPVNARVHNYDICRVCPITLHFDKFNDPCGIIRHGSKVETKHIK